MRPRYYLISDDAETPRAGEEPGRLGPAEGLPRRVSHLGLAAPGRVQEYSYEEQALPEGSFFVETLYSGICEDVELTLFQGTDPGLHAGWDDELKLFHEDGPRETYPLRFCGCMEVGRVAASRTDGAREGEIVAMAYGHKTGHAADAGRDLYFPLPAEMEPVLGVFVARVGPMCANGILYADEEACGSNASFFGAGIRGRDVLVCGTGVTALLTAMMCRWAGAADVAVAGYEPRRLAAAARLGLTALNVLEVDAGQWAKRRWHDGAGRRGAHVAFQCSGSDELLNHAMRALQPQGAVIDMGSYQRGVEAVPLAREFRRNGLRHICAHASEVPRKLSDLWDPRKLATETVAFLQAEGPRVREHLISHSFPLERAQEAFDLLAYEGDQAIQVVLTCG